jgi:hypothetical protein
MHPHTQKIHACLFIKKIARAYSYSVCLFIKKIFLARWPTHDIHSTTLTAIRDKRIGVLEMAPDVLRRKIFGRDNQVLELVFVKCSWIVVVV